MTAIGHDMKLAVSDRGVRLSKMRVPWTRGATSGALLLILGAWAALAPFIGPYLNLAYTPATNTTWHWTAARGWFEVAPGATAFAGGLLLLLSTNRAVVIAGSWLGIAAGGWLIVGPSLADVLNQSIGTPDPASGTRRQALESLSFFYAVGAVILFLAAAALGRLTVRSIRDAALAEQRAAQADPDPEPDSESATELYQAPLASEASTTMALAGREQLSPLSSSPLSAQPHSTYALPDISDE
jgi:hypothetical protein